MWWKIATLEDAPAQPTSLDASVHLQPVAGGGWKSVGERACFTLSSSFPPGGMPAGWYWLSGRLQVADGMVAAPCLYPSYVGGADGDAQIALPDPDDTGLIRALVLFKYGVTSLRFCPVQPPTPQPGRASSREDALK